MEIKLPQVGESVTEGIIGKWLRQVGERVEKYDPLVEVVTDKVTMEMPSPVSGVLAGIVVAEGQTVPMGTVIADIQVEGENEALADSSAETLAAAGFEAADRTGTLLKDIAPVGPTGSGGPIRSLAADAASSVRPRYSPAVLRLAAEHAVDLSRVTGTGIGGRITRKDVQSYVEGLDTERPPRGAEAAQETGTKAAGDERVPLTPIRRIIAENMVRSATEIPEAWTTVEADVTGLVQLRERMKPHFRRREGVALTYLPFVLEAVAESLKENRLVNSSWDGDAIILKGRVNIGVAIATPEGLVVPVVHDADALDIAGLARAIDDLATRARSGGLKVSEVRGGTFTVNNTGALGSVSGKALIKHPEAAILNTEAIVKRPVVIDDAIAIRSIMNLCLTFDHRVLDGAEAGAFVTDIKRRLQDIDPDMES